MSRPSSPVVLHPSASYSLPASFSQGLPDLQQRVFDESFPFRAVCFKISLAISVMSAFVSLCMLPLAAGGSSLMMAEKCTDIDQDSRISEEVHM